MVQVKAHHDALLRRRLESLTKADKDYWSFRGNAQREHGHGLFQYPAMMVPQVASAVLDQICSVHPDIKHVGDPFVGSGTILTESMSRGFAFSGTDINPLAILLCQVKSGPFYINALSQKAEELLARIKADRRWAIDVDFHNRNKWFKRDVQISLSKIRRAICAETSLWARRFFWVALADIVRTTSNSRTSTFKLHIRSQKDIEAGKHSPTLMFEKVLNRNLQHYKKQADKLSASGSLLRGHYTKNVSVMLGDIRHKEVTSKCDVIITSPPYGDNATTVPYGQYSYLPLQWIDLRDIENGVDADFLVTTHEIDTRSLGGSKLLESNTIKHISDRSPAFARYIRALKNQPWDRTQRITAFFRDLDLCLNPILKQLRLGGLMAWTLGNRKVGGKRVPLDKILDELLSARSAKVICKLQRRIPSKRMACKNSVAETISNEVILIMRKAV